MTGRFYVLHNPHDEDSRAFVAAHATDPAVIEVLRWFPEETGEYVETDAGLIPVYVGEGDRERWAKLGGTLGVAAFPAIVYESPGYVLRDLTSGESVKVAPEQAVVNWDPAMAEELRADKVDPISLHLFHATQCAANADALAAVTAAENGTGTGADTAKAVAVAEQLGTDEAKQAAERLAALG